MANEKELFYNPYSSLPGSKPIDVPVNNAVTPSVLERILNKFRKEDGSVNSEADEIKEVMDMAEKNDLDVAVAASAQHVNLLFGKWLFDPKQLTATDKKIIKIGVEVALTAAFISATGATLFILREHRRDS